MQAKTQLTEAVTQAAVETLAMTTGQNISILSAKTYSEEEVKQGVAISVRLVGDIHGNIRLRFTEDAAKRIASALMMG